MKRDRKDFLLYRKENRRVYRNGYIKKGSNFRYQRHSKEANKRFEEGVGYKESIKNAKSSHITSGYDYTPLFMFLLKNIGQDFDKILKEVTPRLNTVEPVYWLVDRTINREQVEEYLSKFEENRVIFNNFTKGLVEHDTTEYNKAWKFLMWGIVRCGENSTYSKMWVDEDNKLQLVNPLISNRKLSYKHFFTESHNGKVLGNG